MDFDYRRAWGLRFLRGLSVLLGLLVLGGCEAGQDSSGSAVVTAADAAPHP